MKIYNILYVLGLIFMTLFFISSLSSINIVYILISLLFFILSGKCYKNESK